MTVISFGSHRRPAPPTEILQPLADHAFVAAPELIEWARAVFINEGGPLHNPDHAHLEQAEIGGLWTNVPNSKAGRDILGTAERGDPMAMGKWAKERARCQVTQWFGGIPDFIMTIYAPYAFDCEDIEFCALVEHELMHMGQEHDVGGAPKFRKNGRPAFTIRGHDVEEFVGIVARYGASATGVSDLVQAANRGPAIGVASIGRACGTCQERRVA